MPTLQLSKTFVLPDGSSISSIDYTMTSPSPSYAFFVNRYQDAASQDAIISSILGRYFFILSPTPPRGFPNSGVSFSSLLDIVEYILEFYPYYDLFGSFPYTVRYISHAG